MYHYDALGNLYSKNCSDSSVYQYLIDPFGKYGADIVAEVRLNNGFFYIYTYPACTFLNLGL